MTAHDPFIKLTKLFTDHGKHQSTPLFLKPESVGEIQNGKVHVGGGYHDVCETAEQIRQIIIEKLEENAQAERMGKT